MNNVDGSPIFIVGNSRSGTTLVSNILRLHPMIYGFVEIHFFEQLWRPSEGHVSIDWQEALLLGAKLIGIAREGRLLLKEPAKYTEEAAIMLAEYSNESISHTDVYKRFLLYETSLHKKEIPCEQTPRYIFYLSEILYIFPNAKVIVMVRDPRDILLSQKNKWKQYRSAEVGAQKREMIRAWFNYHPILLSQMWKQAMAAAGRHSNDDRVKLVHFEELVQNPGQVANDICSFIGLTFHENMLEVPGSLSPLAEGDGNTTGISAAPIARWKNMLSSTDMFWCQIIAGDQMSRLGYVVEKQRVNPLAISFSAVLFPVKAFIALVLNISQSQALMSSIRRRLIG